MAYGSRHNLEDVKKTTSNSLLGKDDKIFSEVANEHNSYHPKPQAICTPAGILLFNNQSDIAILQSIFIEDFAFDVFLAEEVK